MTVSSPPRPPSQAPATPDSKPLEREEIQALVEALIEEARQETRRRHHRYWALAALVAFVGIVVLILLEGGAASQHVSPAVSARSSLGPGTPTSRIAFVQNPSPNLFTEAEVGLYVINPDGSGRRLVTRIAHHGGGVWSPDGQTLAFSRQRDRKHHGIYLVNADGSGLTRLTQGADSGPAWSPDGRKIAFTRGVWSNRHRIDHSTEIYVTNVDGTNKRRLTRNQAQDYGPVWSPDGRMLLFGSDRDADAGSYVMNADGSAQRALSSGRGLDARSAAWSPDGKRIVFSSRNSEIYIMNTDGSGLRRVTRLSGFSYAWSPDGERVAFVGTRVGWGSSGVYVPRGACDLYVMKADGSAPRKLKGTPDWEYVPVWSPDSREIAFVSFRDGDREIYVVNADGSGMRNVTRHPGTDISPAWSPAQR